MSNSDEDFENNEFEDFYEFENEDLLNEYDFESDYEDCEEIER